MDPFERVLPDTDTSFALMLEATARGHAVYHVAPRAVGYAAGACVVTARPATPARGDETPGTLGAAEDRPASWFDVVWVRTDPPFDADYLHVTQLLTLAEESGTLVINRPAALQAANEHLYGLRFPELGPPSLVSADAGLLEAFVDEVGGRMVLKPIDGHGGQGVIVVAREDRNRPALVELLTAGGRTPVLAQAYLRQAREGDKRVLLLDGEVLGAINRIPGEDDHRGNVHVGGRATPTELTARDRAVCEALAPHLRSEGLWFVGLDLIGGQLTDVNVTSPTCIQEMESFSGENLCGRVWDWVEARVR